MRESLHSLVVQRAAPKCVQSAWKFSKFEGSQAVSSCQLDPLRQPSKNLATIPLRPESHRHGRAVHLDRQDEGGELLVAS